MDRAVVMTELIVKGQFEYKDKFKILPTPEDAQISGSVLGWPYPCVIEYENKGEFKEIEQFGMTLPCSFVKNNAFMKKLSEILNIMSLFCKHRFFLYGCQHTWVCTMGKPDEGTEEKLYNGFEYYEYRIKPDYLLKKYPAIEMIEPQKYYSTDNVIDMRTPYTTLPDILPILLDKYFNLNNEARAAFITSAKLFNQGKELLGKGYLSIAFAVLVSSIENLISFIYRDEIEEKCSCCGNVNYHVTKKFKEFMMTYAENTSEFKRRSEMIYKRRSKIMHAGLMFLGEVEPASLSEENHWQAFDEKFYRTEVLSITRLSLINWLISQSD